MTATRRLPALGAALFLLASCGQSGPGATSSTTPSASTSSNISTGDSPQATPTQTTASPAPSAKPPSVKPPLTKPPVAPKAVLVRIRNFAYLTAAPVVTVGQPIEIVNDDVAAHTWSAAPRAGWTYTSGNLEKGQRATFPGFTKPGRYKFLCYYHAEMPPMNGVVTVRATR